MTLPALVLHRTNERRTFAADQTIKEDNGRFKMHNPRRSLLESNFLLIASLSLPRPNLFGMMRASVLAWNTCIGELMENFWPSTFCIEVCLARHSLVWIRLHNGKTWELLLTSQQCVLHEWDLWQIENRTQNCNKSCRGMLVALI